MRPLTSATALALLAFASSLVNSHAARRACDCPTIRISCPDNFRVGVDAAFTAVVSNFGSDSKLTYKWTISAGTIITGQGTNLIVVDTTELTGETFTATVEVNGIPKECHGSVSCSIFDYTPLIRDPPKIDEYGNISFSDEKARLGNLAAELRDDQTSVGYIICYGGRRGYAGEALRRCKRAANYLTKTRGIDASRIKTIDGGYREGITVELWVYPAEAAPPMASPTVDPKEVQTIKDRPKGRRHY